MTSYSHFSGFLIPAKDLGHITGREYENGWLVDRTDFRPWYLRTSLQEHESLETEMKKFLPSAQVPEEKTGIIRIFFKIKITAMCVFTSTIFI